MQFYEATQNRHFEKIRKAVIMQRHPKAKNFDEALMLETVHNDCLIYWNISSLGINVTDGKTMKELLFVTKKYYEMLVTYLSHQKKYSGIQKAIQNFSSSSNHIFLGREIRLEEIIILLNNMMDLKKHPGGCWGINLSHFDYETYYLTCASSGMNYIDEWFCKVLINKPLHEQAPQTWAAIAKLIG